MYRQKIELLIKEARKHLKMARSFPSKLSREFHLKSAKECVHIAVSLKKMSKSNQSTDFKLTLIKRNTNEKA